MELLAVGWLLAVVGYFSVTTARQRENHLLMMWGLLLLPVVGYPIMRLLGL